MVNYSKKKITHKNPTPSVKPKKSTQFSITYDLEKELDIIFSSYEKQYHLKSPHRYTKCLAVREKLGVRRFLNEKKE